MHHKRKLNFTGFENNPEGSIWSLFWYGRISFKKSKSKFYIEAYFVLMNKENYYLTSINKNRVQKLEIPFSKSILFPLSSQFDNEGKYLRMSNIFNNEGVLLSNGLYKRGTIRMSNGFNFRKSGLENFFYDSSFPEVMDNGVSIYQNAFYFHRKIEYTLKKNPQDNTGVEIQTSKEVNEYIIPIDVIIKYFFGYSALLLDLLITDKLKRVIFDVSFDKKNGKGKLSYDGKLISRSDVDKIAMYFFTKNDAAYKMMRKIGAYFSAIRLNNETQASFVKFKLPFDFPCDFLFVGQYFKNIEGEFKHTRFLVNQILEAIGTEDFFLTNDIEITDINPSDTTYHDQIEVKDQEQGKNVKNTGDKKPNNEEEEDDIPPDQNDKDKIVNKPIELRNCFNQFPTIHHFVQKKDKNNEYVYVNDERPNNHTDFPDFNGNSKRKIHNLSAIDWRNIFYEVIEYLIQEHKYVANCLSDSGTAKRIAEKIIYELNYGKVNYYIIESGGNNYFPLFRNQKDKETIDIDVIHEIINLIKNEFKSSWLIVSNKKSIKENKNFAKIDFFKDNDILFLRNNTHEPHINPVDGLVDIEKTIKNQAKKIHKKIKKDLNELSKN